MQFRSTSIVSGEVEVGGTGEQVSHTDTPITQEGIDRFIGSQNLHAERPLELVMSGVEWQRLAQPRDPRLPYRYLTPVDSADLNRQLEVFRREKGNELNLDQVQIVIRARESGDISGVTQFQVTQMIDTQSGTEWDPRRHGRMVISTRDFIDALRYVAEVGEDQALPTLK